MTAAKSTNLAIAFLLELAMLVALATWGWSAGSSVGTRVLWAVLAPAAAIIAWGSLLAPRSSRRLPRPWLEFVKTALFAVAAAGLWGAGHPVVAVALFSAFLMSLAFAVAWEQDEVAGSPG